MYNHTLTRTPDEQVTTSSTAAKTSPVEVVFPVISRLRSPMLAHHIGNTAVDIPGQKFDRALFPDSLL